MPAIFGCTIILILLIRYKNKKHSRQNKESINDFLRRDLEANTTRKKDISGLPYLTADCGRLPVTSCPDPDGEINAVLQTLQALDGTKMLNLSGTSNTDLKLAYGAANFPELSECDARFTSFTRNLYQLGFLLKEAGEEESAIQVLRYALELHTDIGATYRLLGGIFAARHDTAALEDLNKQASSLPELTRGPVCQYLSGLLSCHSPE